MLKKIYNLILLGMLFVGLSVFAGSPTPDPASPGAGPYTLSDIYNKLTLSTYEYSTHDFVSPVTPAGTFVTLAQIWNAIPPYLSLVSGSLDSGILLHGIYGESSLTSIEPNLVASKIAEGVNIFGVVGTCVPNTYSLIYNGNGSGDGEVPIDSEMYKRGDEVSVSGNTGELIKDGFDFSSWNTAADGNGTDRVFGTTFVMGKANVTLYAKWVSSSASSTYTVTYNGNGNTGGSVPINSNTYEEGDTVTVLYNTDFLVKDGYTFSGWNTEIDGGGIDRAEGETFSMGTENVVLYAKWIENSQNETYSVTYDGNGSEGGTVPLDTNAYEAADTVTVLGNTGLLTRVDYTFAGWNTQADGNGLDRLADSTFIIGLSDVILYAKWTANPVIPTYTVTYDGNGNDGGTAVIDPNSYEDGASVTVLDNTGPFTKDGYTFIGWSTTSGCDGTNRDVGSDFVIGSADITLYARWLSDNTDYAWIANQGASSVTKLNGSACPVGTYSISTSPSGVAVDTSNNVWISHGDSSGKVTKLNASTGAVIGVYSVGSSPVGIAVDVSGNVWVTNYINNGTVTKLNGSTGAIIGTYSLGTTLSGKFPIGITADASGNIWVANFNEGTVQKLDASTGATLGIYNAGPYPYGVAVDADNNLWVSLSNHLGNNSQVAKMNGSTGEIISTTTISRLARGIAVDADNNVWVSTIITNKVTKLDGSTGAVIGSYNTGTYPMGVAVDSQGQVWVANYTSNSVSIFDSSNGDLIDTYSVGSHPTSLGDFTGYALQHFILGQ